MKLVLPAELEGMPVVASVSGGKDSTALTLALAEAGIEHRRVFADTGWEAPETYAYLDMLHSRLGPIDVVRAAPKADSPDTGSPMVDRIRHRAGFPARMQRWCTRELKIDPLRRYHDALGVETVSVVGVRAEESAARAAMAVVDDDAEWGGWIWRPLLAWSTADVIGIHHRHGVPLNPLYLRGHDRVGCFPCIFARKDEVRLVADHAPERIDQIAQLEEEVAAIRAARNTERPGRYAHMQGSFFQTTLPGSRSGFVPIAEVVRWSRTSRGGRQMPLLAEPPSGGCFRWGLCEPPSRGGDLGGDHSEAAEAGAPNV